MSIKNFSEWGSLNEGVTPEQADKVFDEAEKWSKTTDIKISVDKEHLHDWMGTGHIWANGIFGSWRLELEKSTKKGSQDSMYRQTYERGEDKKWYITYPGRWSQYNSRGRTKPGNIKTFRALVEEFNEVKKVFDKVSFFFENALGIKKIDTTHYQNSEGYYTVEIQGPDLKNLRAFGVGLAYNRTATNWQAGGWVDADPTTVSILHKALSSKSPQLQKPIEEAGNDYEMIMEILEAMKDYPLDKFLEETKTGDWESVKKKHIGKIGGSKYGL